MLQSRAAPWAARSSGTCPCVVQPNYGAAEFIVKRLQDRGRYHSPAASTHYYLCVWGPDFECVHDIADELVVGDRDGSPWQHVVTTWDDADSLFSAASFAREEAKRQFWRAAASGGCRT